jgi:hypothetical protein
MPKKTVQFILLIDGTEVVGHIVPDKDKNALIIERPMVLIKQPVQTKKGTITRVGYETFGLLFAALPPEKQVMTFPKDSVLFGPGPIMDKDLEEGYYHVISTLHLPSKKAVNKVNQSRN